MEPTNLEISWKQNVIALRVTWSQKQLKGETSSTTFWSLLLLTAASMPMCWWVWRQWSWWKTGWTPARWRTGEPMWNAWLIKLSYIIHSCSIIEELRCCPCSAHNTKHQANVHKTRESQASLARGTVLVYVTTNLPRLSYLLGSFNQLFREPGTNVTEWFCLGIRLSCSAKVKNKSWFGLQAALRDLLYDWTLQQQALLALERSVEACLKTTKLLFAWRDEWRSIVSLVLVLKNITNQGHTHTESSFRRLFNLYFIHTGIQRNHIKENSPVSRASLCFTSCFWGKWTGRGQPGSRGGGGGRGSAKEPDRVLQSFQEQRSNKECRWLHGW